MKHEKDWMPTYVGPFKDLIPEYIRFRRAQGYVFGEPILYRLREMDILFQSMGVAKIEMTREMYDAFTKLKSGERESNITKRLSAYRGFAKYLRSRGYDNIYTGDDDTRIFKNDFIPYIFSVSEIQALFTTLKTWCAENPSRRNDTFLLIMTIYYCCGLRKDEAQSLKIQDIDFEKGILTVLHGKNDVTRLIPVSETLRGELCKYRDKYLSHAMPEDFFLSYIPGRKISDSCLYHDFHQMLSNSSIQPREDGRLQRLHDMRHTFCVHTLEEMQRKGFDLYTSLPLLSTYLGHKHITETEYYLRMMEEHFGNILEKSNAYAGGLFPDVYDAGKDGKAT